MDGLIRICGIAELPASGRAKAFETGGTIVCVANVDGILYAMGSVCPHRGGPLAEGVVEEGKLICPWHAWAFDPATGQASHDAERKVDVYALTTEGIEVFLKR